MGVCVCVRAGTGEPPPRAWSPAAPGPAGTTHSTPEELPLPPPRPLTHSAQSLLPQQRSPVTLPYFTLLRLLRVGTAPSAASHVCTHTRSCLGEGSSRVRAGDLVTQLGTRRKPGATQGLGFLGASLGCVS